MRSTQAPHQVWQVTWHVYRGRQDAVVLRIEAARQPFARRINTFDAASAELHIPHVCLFVSLLPPAPTPRSPPCLLPLPGDPPFRLSQPSHLRPSVVGGGGVTAAAPFVDTPRVAVVGEPVGVEGEAEHAGVGSVGRGEPG